MTSEQSTAPSYNTGGIELTACQLHEALLMAGTPELGVPFEDRGRVRIFQSETGHSGPGLYCECVDVEEEGCILLDGTSPAVASPAQAVDLEQTFQAGVAEWMGRCFLPSLYSNMTERGDRLLEEVLELLQAHGYDSARVPTLVDYVFGRPVGEPAQEVGGVMVTLAGYCWVAGLDMHVAGDAELARINQPDVMAKIRAKQEAKNALHFDTPLPGHAAHQTVGEPVGGECEGCKGGIRYDAKGCTCTTCGKRPKWYMAGRRIRVTERRKPWKHLGAPVPFEAECTWQMGDSIDYRLDGETTSRRLNNFHQHWEKVEVIR
ncbi:hypothetical protein [Stenotrophomonas indicatrix]|uniref:hypothetical protein n=1 Tax=Stenotrophomonas indicatrix TaxID=2045451 RepID=UPI001CC0DA19|nr:hypothetical protein [Stenotrophomonas indicatrix]